MRRSIRTTIVLLVASLAAALTTISGTSAQGLHHNSFQQTPPPPPFSGTPVIGTPPPTKKVKLSHAFHTLNAKQRKLILKIVHNDKNVKKLLKHRHYHVSTVTIWVNKAAKPLGGVVSIRFKGPQTISGTFIALQYTCTSITYKRIFYSAKYAHVTNLTVSVDTHHKKVEGILPLGYVVGTIRYHNPLAVATPTPGSCHS